MTPIEKQLAHPKERSDLLNLYRHIFMEQSKVCNYISAMCKNSGFNTVFIMKHIDKQLIKQFRNLDIYLQELHELNLDPHNLEYQMHEQRIMLTRIAILKVFSVAFDQNNNLLSMLKDTVSSNIKSFEVSYLTR